MLGSKLFTKPKANKPHVVKNRLDGISGEVGKLRQDLANETAPLAAIAVEEWDDPVGAAVDLIKTTIATSTAAAVYRRGNFNGTVGANAFTAPRLVSVTQTSGNHYAGSVTFKGYDAQGKGISASIALTANPGITTTTASTKYLAQVTEIDVPAQQDLLGNLQFGISGNDLGLSRPPKARTGALFIDFEAVDGAAVTSGALVDAATAPPYGAYAPATAPTTLSSAVITGIADITAASLYGVAGPAIMTGTADITAGALYGIGATLDGKTLTLNVDGAGATSLVLNGATNTANEGALLAAILVQWPALASAVAGGPGGNKLVLTTTATGAAASIVVTTTTGSTALGITGSALGTGDLDTLTLILNVNSAGNQTLTLNGATNAANEAALLAAILVKWPALASAVAGGPGGNKLVLTTTLQGPTASIVVGAGTANTELGTTGLSNTGGGHQYAAMYEYDAGA